MTGKGDDFKLKTSRFRLDFRMKFFTIRLVKGTGKGHPEKLTCSIPEGVQGQIDRSSRQPDLIDGIPARDMGTGTR